MSNARWMQRAIDAFKAYLFREKLDLNEDEELIRQLERFCTFVAVIYVKYWNRCTNAIDAGYNDFSLLKDLEVYMEYDTEIAQTAKERFHPHLYYFGEELIPLSLFSAKVSNEEKKQMRDKLLSYANSIMRGRTIDSCKYNIPQFGSFNTLNMQLHDFIILNRSYIY